MDFIRKRLSDLARIETYGEPDTVPVEAPAQQEIGRLAADREQFQLRTEAAPGQFAGPALPVVLAGLGQGKENARQFLKDNPEIAATLEATLREKFVPAEAQPEGEDGADED